MIILNNNINSSKSKILVNFSFDPSINIWLQIKYASLIFFRTIFILPIELIVDDQIAPLALGRSIPISPNSFLWFILKLADSLPAFLRCFVSFQRLSML